MELTDMISGLNLDSISTEDTDKIKLLLQNIDDTISGGLRSANFVEYRNTYVVNAQDSLDASYPMYVHFNIISEMIKIISIKISFWFLNFRAYSTAASSGGAVTSASGGGETPTTSSGGSSTPTTSSGGGQTTSSGGGQTSSAGGAQTSSATGTPSGGGSTSGNGGGQTSSVDSYGTVVGYYPTAAPSFSHNIGDENINGFIITQSTQYTLSTKNHTHTVANHTHTTPAHTHPNHTHTVSNHTHTVANHTHTVSNHTHTVSIANHTHTVSIANHTHTGGAHTHGITYGIFEDSTSPTVMFSVSKDNGKTYSLAIGSYTADQENLDITSFIDTVGGKMIKFTTSARTRLSVQIEIKLDIKARG